MTDLLEFLAKSLVDHPEEVHVEEYDKHDALILRLKITRDDYGKIIGKKGKNIQALLTLVRAAGFRQKKPIEIHLDGQKTLSSL